MEVTMLKQQIAEMEQHARMARSTTLNIFIDLKVMLEDGDVDEALEMLEGLT